MDNVGYVKEQATLFKMYFKAIGSIIVIAFIGFLVVHLIEPSKSSYYVEPLSEHQLYELTVRIDGVTYRTMHRNGCYQVIVEKIQNNTWSDSWCATTYKHLNLKGIK